MLSRFGSTIVRAFAPGLMAVSTFAAVVAPGPFFEADQPFFQAQIQLTPPPKGEMAGGNFVVRGIVLPLANQDCLVFDQELLRVAGFWKTPADQPPITLTTMAPISYATMRRKAGADHPQPTGRPLLLTGMHPGVGVDAAALFTDPRPPRRPDDEGRGPLPSALARFDGIELAGATAVLRYRVSDAAIAEWHESVRVDGETRLLRHFEVAPHVGPLFFAIGAAGSNPWMVRTPQSATTEAADVGRIDVLSNTPTFTLAVERDELVAMLAPSDVPQRVSLAIIAGSSSVATLTLGPTPTRPVASRDRRWAGEATSSVQLESVQQNGLVLDRVATPDENPWRRRVRVADLAFLGNDRAAVVTFDGDVWLVDGFDDPKLTRVTWRRFASGLHEPLAIAAPGGVIQVATKNGVVRVHDRDGNGEADWVENFNDQMLQSQTTRSFPLDMAIGPDGSTFVSQGGIVTRSGLSSGGNGTPHTGAILRISPDGRKADVFATGMREPFLAVHPGSGVVTATDQQGHFIPSSVSYLVRPGDDFGFLQENPSKLALPLAWIPHDQDSSSSSEVWVLGAGMGEYDGKLFHLSYGTGRLFLITPDLDAPVPQGAVIPLDLKTDLPLLHARMHPSGNALYLAGFQIWGTRTTTSWALGRLRRGNTPIVTALAARSVADGVVLTFAEPLDPQSLEAGKVTARAWNYRRSSAYGSGRYQLDGGAGTTAWPVGQTVLSRDGRAVFVHLPKLPAVQQLELRHDFRLVNGAAARGVVYFTIHAPHARDLQRDGFPPIDLTQSLAVVATVEEEPATPEMGRAVAESFGCIACHSNDGTTDGKVGPTWRQLFGATRTFIDGSREIADELYLREKILDPQQKKSKAGPIEMPSYRGVLTEQQLEALVLYIKSLAGPARSGAKRP